MKKRVLAALLVTMMTVGTVAGCGSNAKSDDSDKKASSESKSDDKKDSGKKVTVVTSGTGEPYSLISDDGKWTGIDAEMWDEIEKRTGWEVEVKQASFDAMWGELDTGRADVVANCLAVKEERTDKYNATIPYYGDSQCIIVNDDSDYKTSDDLKGKTVGCTNGQAAQTIIEDMAKEKGFTVKLYEDSAVGMNDLKLGRIDAYANTTTNVNTAIEVGMQDFIIMPDESIDIKIDLNFTVEYSKNLEINVIQNIQSGENRTSNPYSMTIYFAKPGDSLWKIAKKFRSTVDNIAKVNGIEDVDKIEVGQQLFIPRYNG